MHWSDCADLEQVVLEAVFSVWAQRAGLNYLGPDHDPVPGLHFVVLTRGEPGDGARYTLELVDPATGGSRRLSAAVMRPAQVLNVLPMMLIDGDHPFGEKVAQARLPVASARVQLPVLREPRYAWPSGPAPSAAPPPCEPCDGLGWMINQCVDHGLHTVERCDSCKVYATDEAAAEAARTWVRSHR